MALFHSQTRRPVIICRILMVIDMFGQYQNELRCGRKGIKIILLIVFGLDQNWKNLKDSSIEKPD